MNDGTKKGAQKVESEEDIQLRELGNLMKAYRLEKKLSSESLADQAGINRSQYSRYENGLDDLRYTSLRKVAKVLGKTLRQFFEGLD